MVVLFVGIVIDCVLSCCSRLKQKWASEWGGLAPVDFEIIRKKRVFFQFRGV